MKAIAAAYVSVFLGTCKHHNMQLLQLLRDAETAWMHVDPLLLEQGIETTWLHGLLQAGY